MKQKFVEGLVFGIGVGVVLVVATIIAYFVVPWNKVFTEQATAMSEESMKMIWSSGKIVLLTHERVIRGEDVFVLGRLKNEGPQTARNFSIEVDLFDKNDKFVDLCRESLFTQVKPGEERHFKVTCGGCRNRPTAQHASYKIRVVEG